MTRVPLILALLVACGDDGGNRNEAPDAPLPPDGMVAPGMARVTVVIGGVQRAGHPVTFQDPDGAELATVMTDASGVAEAMVPEGSSVTAYDIYNVGASRRSIVTVVGVKPGDSIELRGDASAGQEDQSFSFTAYEGAQAYEVMSTCGRSGASIDTTPTFAAPRCSARVDTLVLAAGSKGEAIGYLVKLDQPIGQLVDLTGETWTATMWTSSSYLDAPVFTESRATRRYSTTRGVFGVCPGFPSAGVSYDFACPVVPGASVVEELWLWESSVGRYVYSLDTSAPVDLMGAAITGPTDIPAFQAPRDLVWPERTGVTPQFVVAQVEGSGAQENPFQWNILAPYGGATLRLPTLTGEGAMYNSLGEAGASVWLGTADGGYDAIRQLGPIAPGSPQVNAATGRVVLAGYES